MNQYLLGRIWQKPSVGLMNSDGHHHLADLQAFSAIGATNDLKHKLRAQFTALFAGAGKA